MRYKLQRFALRLRRRMASTRPRPLHRFADYARHSRAIAAALVIVGALVAYSGYFTGINTFVINHEDGVTVHETYTRDAHIALMEAGFFIGENDYVSLPGDPISGNGAEIEIIRAKTVHIALDGKTHEVVTLGGTVSDALRKLGYERGEHDVIAPGPDMRIENGMDIQVTRFQLTQHIEEISLPFETEYVSNSSLYEDDERITQEGIQGLRALTYEVTLRDGAEIARRLVSDETLQATQNQIIEQGTKKHRKTFTGLGAALPVANAGTLTLPDGSTLAYTHTLNASATAYTTERQKSKTNASGKIARVGTIAVDPKVIPLGSKVYIVAADGSWVYGTAVCEDTGGVVKGNIIDLFFDTWQECITFGRRAAVVYILAPEA